ncbi:hypothetical protein [Leptospira inadai]|uniref:Uncharacterized protein n=1 Tax=Leptospira inadai serovar Lyme TaxID=293084 RepID=A0ABX4YGI6_9LEPT|nr:hypothetical protein [Leptospira inadai]PNV74373.1 hypothetical protein BES34_014410 [Leptospira inadai serovar Lyme]
MNAENRFLEYLPQFNSSDPEFKKLFGDVSRPEFFITNINDINKGALYNSIEWHLRFQESAVSSSNLSNADGYFLKYWADLLNIQRPSGLDDPSFVSYILGTILSGECSITRIAEIFSSPLFTVLNSNEFGFASDLSATDVGICPPGPSTSFVSSVVTPDRLVTYVLTKDKSNFTLSLFTKLNRMVAAGTSVYFGVT